MSTWQTSILELITRASTDLPTDVEQALQTAQDREEPGSNAQRALATMLENTALARQNKQPLCQDTGTLLFWVDAPPRLTRTDIEKEVCAAVDTATERGLLRANCVDAVTGHNSGRNVGKGSPAIHWRESARDTVRVALLLKGGGCENVSAQYALPDGDINAQCDLDGVHRCCLDAVHRAQGRGCAPGILGVCVGGDRESGYTESKRQLLRPLGQRSENRVLAGLEARILADANKLGIGPMGFGGSTTLLDVFVSDLCRLPASYFVTISYLCWSARRHIIETDPDGRIHRWIS